MNNAGVSVKTRLLIQTTAPESLGFFHGQFEWLQAEGFEVHTVCGSGEAFPSIEAYKDVHAHLIPMRRRVAAPADLLSLLRIARVYLRLRPSIVHGFTPKGGLLAMIAAWMTFRPVRLYTIFGLVHMSSTGIRRRILKLVESIPCTLAHRVYCECESIKEVAVRERICPEHKIRVLPAWSLNGLESVMKRSVCASAYRNEVRRERGIGPDCPVVGYVGRIVPDKGIVELFNAFVAVRQSLPRLHLMLVGRTEREHPLSADFVRNLEATPRVHLVGFQDDVVPYLASMDVLAHPSYREGLPTAPLEAAAMGIPVVATDIPGCVDAVINGITGLLVPPRDPAALAEALRELLINRKKCVALGEAARRWAATLTPQRSWESLVGDYRELAQLEIPSFA